MRLDAAQAVLLVCDRLLDLSSAQTQHSAQLLERRLPVEHTADLLEREPEISQRQQPVQCGELCTPYDR